MRQQRSQGKLPLPLDGETPFLHEEPVMTNGPTKLVSIPVFSGLHHIYKRVAASYREGYTKLQRAA